MSESRSVRRKSLIRKIIALMICVILVLAAVAGYMYYQRKHMSYDLTMAYTLSDEEGGNTAVQDARMAPSFAADLCVSKAVVEDPDISLTSDEEYALLFDTKSDSALFANHIYDRVYPASITKIMTAILCSDQGDMDQEVTMTDADVNLGSDAQLSGLRAGDVVTMRQLFCCLLVYSANDAAMAIARTIGGSVEKFVEMMNQKAKELGMTGTHFVNPHGLHDDNHYTTPYDVYLMLNEASKHKDITEIMQYSVYKLEVGKDASYRAYNLPSTDKYLSGEHALPSGVTIMAGKTGTTSQAGACLAIAVQNSYGEPYVAIVMNAQNKDILYQDMDQLLAQVNK